jgi:mono/diheme cytochrome c family protein
MASRRFPQSLAIALAGLAGVFAAGAAAQPPVQSPERKLTFDKDIAPIIFKQCSYCHRPGQEAPFSLLTYEDVKSRASLIVAVTKDRYMPPWKPTIGYGHFQGERHLTDEQIAMLRDWVRQGEREGNPKDLPPTPHFSSDWSLGPPDLVVKFQKPFAVPAGGPDLYHCFIVPLNISQDHYVKAFDFRPNPPNVVHHVIVVLDPFGAAKRLESSPGDGYSCYGGFSFPVPGYLGIWTAGATPMPEPPGVAKVLKKGSDLVIQMHFHPSGRAETELPSIGLYFQKERPKKIPFDITLGSVAIDIPPGDKDYKVTDFSYVMKDVDLIGIIPHCHKLCTEVKAHATLPDGKDVPLIWIKNWDFNFQEQYRYSKPILLPQGTRIDSEWIYNNSTDNPRNPNTPPKRVTWGEGTNDEMAELHLEVVSAPYSINSADFSSSENRRDGKAGAERGKP